MKIFNNVIKCIDLEEVSKNNIIVPNSISTLTAFYYKMQQVLEVNCFFEIGAFEAGFSRTMKQMHPLSDVWAFEANPYNYEHFKNINSNINYLNLAISDINGKIKFQLQDKHINNGLEIEKVRGNNSILNRNDDTISYKEIDIESITMDSFVEKECLTEKSFSLWVDVEGASKNIFLGFEKYVKNSFSILIEVEEHEYWKNQWLCKDVCNFLEEKDFIPIMRDFEDNKQYNVVFINKKILENKSIEFQINNLIEEYFNNLQLQIEF